MAQTTEIKVLISSDSTELQKTNDELEATGAVAGDVNKKFKELEATNKNTEKGFVSLRARVREAKEALQQAEDRFGPFSKEANVARQRAGELADQMADLNRQVSLLNPEDRIKAFTNLGQGVVGAFSIATGAVQAFGAENERVEAIARKLQGALNIIQGIQSIIGLKEAYQDLKIVLGLTTTAQQTLAIANEAEAASAQTATVANRGLAASLGPIVLIVGALAAAYYLLADSQDEATASLDDLNAAYDELKKNQELALAIAKEQGASEVELLELRKQNNKLYQDTLANILKVAKEEKDRKGIQSQINDLKREETLLGVQIEGAIKNATQAELERQQKIREEREKNQQGLKNQFDAEFAAQTALVDKQLNLNKLANEAFILNNEDRVAQDLENEADAIRQKIEIANQFGKDTQELYAQLAIINKKIKKQEVDEVKKAEEEKRQIAIGLAQESFDFIRQLSEQSSQRQIDDLEKQKQQGIITEEQYQEKLKQIETAAAKRQKELAIFSATVAFAEALVKALTTPNPPASLVLAAAVGGLNLAKIIATPIPRFKEGTLNVGGGNLDADGGMHAIVHRGEAIIPADRNKSYHPTLEAIYNKQISPAEINSYVLNRLAGKSGIGRDTVVASVDTYGLSRALSKNKSVQIENAQTVGKAIASELARGYNRRQIV